MKYNKYDVEEWRKCKINLVGKEKVCTFALDFERKPAAFV